MPKRKSRSAQRIRAALLLAAGALLIFVAAETWKLWRSDSGRVMLAARFGLGDPARVTSIVGREIRGGVVAAGVPADSIEESVTGAGVKWRVGLPAEVSPLQTNYSITRRIEAAGATVLSGTEKIGAHGETIVELRIGLSSRALHDVTLVRMPPSAEQRAAEPARLALVLYGFGEIPDQAESFFALPVPFAAAIVPGAPVSGRLFHAAHQHEREIVMHLPLEPIHYPQLNPGPGTILVTMNEARITGLLRRHFDQAGDVVAVANHMGSLATQDMAVMTAIERELARRNVPFLHVQPAAGAVCKPLAAKLGVAYQEPDVVLDAETRDTKSRALDQAWKAALDQARKRHHLVVMMRATPRVLTWLPQATMTKRLGEVNLVPLTAVIRKPVGL